MKKILKWLIPCLVACFMVAGLLQTASFTFAVEEDPIVDESDTGSNPEVLLQNPSAGDEGDLKDELESEDLSKDKDEKKEGIPNIVGLTPTLLTKRPDGSIDTYDATLDPYESFIKVTKVINGYDSIKNKLNGFYINVSGNGKENNFYLTDLNKVGNSTWSWILYGTGTGDYTVKEENANVPNYILQKSINGELWNDDTYNVTVANKNLSIKKPVWDDTAATKQFTVSETDGLNKVLVANVGQGNGKQIVVISAKKLSLPTQNYIKDYIEGQLESGDHPAKWTTENGIHFYSLDDLNDDVVNKEPLTVHLGERQFTYYPDQNVNVVFGGSNINASMTFEFTYVDGQDADIVITNTYTPATKTITVEKQWFDANENKITDSNPEESVTIALGKIENGIWTEIEDGSRIPLSASQEKDKNWKGSWTVPIYDEQGQAIIYEVREVQKSNDENGQDTIISGDIKYSGSKYIYSVAYDSSDTDNNENNGHENFIVQNRILTKDIQIVKDVTGNGANLSDEFEFSYVVKDKDEKVIKIEDNQTFNLIDKDIEETQSNKSLLSKTITVPIGATVVITESDADGYTVSATYDATNSNTPAPVKVNQETKTFTITVEKDKDLVIVTNSKEAAPITGITDNTPKGLGMIGTIVAEVVAIAFVLKKKRQLKM